MKNSGELKRLKISAVEKMMKEERRKTHNNLLYVLENITYSQKKLPPLDQNSLEQLGNQGVDKVGVWPIFTDELLLQYWLSEEKMKYSINETSHILCLDIHMYLIEKVTHHVIQLQMKLEFMNPVIGTDGIRVRMGHFFLYHCTLIVTDLDRNEKLTYHKAIEEDDIIKGINHWMQEKQIKIVVGRLEKEDDFEKNVMFHHTIHNMENVTNHYQIETQNGMRKVDRSFSVYLRIGNKDIPAGIVLENCKYVISFQKQKFYHLQGDKKILVGEVTVYLPLVLDDAILLQENWRKYSLQPEEASLIPTKVPTNL